VAFSVTNRHSLCSLTKSTRPLKLFARAADLGFPAGGPRGNPNLKGAAQSSHPDDLNHTVVQLEQALAMFTSRLQEREQRITLIPAAVDAPDNS